jgi:tetratricopeptide (TPR) repeat protein
MRFRRSWFVLPFVLLVAQESVAADTDAQVNPAARQRYQRAAQAYSEGRFKDAIDMFLDASRLSPNPAYAYNIGLAYEQLGDAPNALRWFREYLRALPEAPDRPEIEPRIAQAEKHLRELGVQQVTVLGSPEGATVAIDGRRVGVTPWTGELTPGRHRAGLEFKGYADVDHVFELPSDHAVDVSLVMLKDDAEKGAAAKVDVSSALTPATSPGERSPWEKIQPLTWATLGVGTAGLAIALGLEVARSSSQSDVSAQRTNLAAHDEYDTTKSRETAARIAVGVGGALVAVGGVLLYFDLSKGSHGGPKTTAGIGCNGALCGVKVHGVF